MAIFGILKRRKRREREKRGGDGDPGRIWSFIVSSAQSPGAQGSRENVAERNLSVWDSREGT